MAGTETTYPSGYGTAELTLPRLMAKHMPTDKVEPEFRRRIENWIKAQGGKIGFGDILPRSGENSVSAASLANKSFHQLQKFSDGTEWACAIDLVVRRDGAGHSSGNVSWDDVPEQGSDDAEDWGVHCNVSNEAWHMQAVPMDGHTRWVNAGRKRPVAGYPIPTVDSPAPAPAPAPPVSGVSKPEQLPTLRMSPPRTQQEKNYVALVQVILNKCQQGVTVDGWFGSQTDKAVRNVQKFFGLEVDGIVGPKTWALLHAINVWAG